MKLVIAEKPSVAMALALSLIHISMLQSQLFNLLCDKADDEYGGRLPVQDVYKRQRLKM